MDIFIDKLAQRTTAQEIIKANTAADVEELNKLKNQIGEYNECLAKLRKLIDEGSEKLTGIQLGENQAKQLVEESLEEIQALQRTVEGFEQSQKKVAEQLESMDKSVVWQLELMSKSLEEKIGGLNGLTEEQLTERLNAVEENVHKECVKVYRNVQAVVTEESGKQNEVLTEAQKGTEAVTGKMGAVLGISLAAMIFSLAGVVFQILSGLGVLPF